MNATTIKTKVENLVLDLPTTTQGQILDWINEAVREAEQGHNYKHMEAVTTVIQTVVGTRELAVMPTDWKEARGRPYYVEAGTGKRNRIDWAPSEDSLVDEYGDSITLDSGPPAYLLEAPDDELYVFPYPDGESDYPNGEYRITLPYWAYSVDLNETTETTNWFTSKVPYYLVHKAAGFAFAHNFDEQRAQHHFSLAEALLNKVKRQDKRRAARKITNLGISFNAQPSNLTPRR